MVDLVIDTDLGFYVDDVGAVAVANHLADIGLCEILGVVYITACLSLCDDARFTPRLRRGCP